jgi:hypothetical protein
LSARAAVAEDKPSPLSPSAKGNTEDVAGPDVKPLSHMTMLERQAHWMAKKKDALEAQKAEREREASSLTFKPDTQHSKRTYKAKSMSEHDVLTESRAEPAHAPVPRVANLPRVASLSNLPVAASSNAGGNKWSVLRNKVTNGALKKVAKPKKLKQKKIAHDPANGESDDDGEDGKEEIEESEEEYPKLEKTPDHVVVEVMPEVVVAAPEPEPFVEGSFWWKIEGGRGQHRVNDGGAFQMWSIYRKKDKTRDVNGVSMLVGRMEAPPYQEKVIQMMFDVDIWTEENSKKWWKENGHRYTGEADKETGALQIEHKPVPLVKKPFDALDPTFTVPEQPA